MGDAAAEAGEKARGRPFVKGQSGNPGGKSKGITLAYWLRREAERKINRKTKLERVAVVVFDEAQAGNLRAIEFIADRLDGKVVERHEHAGPEGGAIPLVIEHLIALVYGEENSSTEKFNSSTDDADERR